MSVGFIRFMKMIGISLVFAASGTMVVAETQNKYIHADKLRMLLENFENYMEEQESPIVVIVGKIPDPEITAEDISNLAVNINPVPVPVPTTPREVVVSNVLTIFGPEVDCIQPQAELLAAQLPQDTTLVNFSDFLNGLSCE